MGRYLLLWEIDETKVPIDRKERGAGWGALLGVVKQDIEKGLVKEWGVFFGQPRGYNISEGTELEILNSIQQFVPFIRFEVHPIVSMDMVEEMIKALSE